MPNRLKDTHYKDSDKIVKDAYLYPHDFGGYVKQDYLADDFKDVKFYEPKDLGYEKEMVRNLRKIKEGYNEDKKTDE